MIRRCDKRRVLQLRLYTWRRSTIIKVPIYTVIHHGLGVYIGLGTFLTYHFSVLCKGPPLPFPPINQRQNRSVGNQKGNTLNLLTRKPEGRKEVAARRSCLLVYIRLLSRYFAIALRRARLLAFNAPVRARVTAFSSALWSAVRTRSGSPRSPTHVESRRESVPLVPSLFFCPGLSHHVTVHRRSLSLRPSLSTT